MARKTIEVDKILKKINAFIRTDTSGEETRRKFIQLGIDLLRNGAGYEPYDIKATYLTPKEVPEDQKPGIWPGPYMTTIWKGDNPWDKPEVRYYSSFMARNYQSETEYCRRYPSKIEFVNTDPTRIRFLLPGE